MAKMILDLTQNECTQMLNKNYIGHLAYMANKNPYTVPVTYYYHSETSRILSYSASGHKISAMRLNKSVSIGIDEIHSVVNWKSVLVHGVFKELTGPDAKFYLHEFANGVRSVLNRTEKYVQFISDFSSKLNSKVPPVVYAIEVLDITGKYRKF
jgi:uncharacterized protein